MKFTEPFTELRLCKKQNSRKRQNGLQYKRRLTAVYFIAVVATVVCQVTLPPVRYTLTVITTEVLGGACYAVLEREKMHLQIYVENVTLY